MTFTDFSFFVFLPIVFSLHWWLPNKFRWVLLLIASLYFYMSWDAKYVILILFTTFISYACGLLLERAKSGFQKKCCLIACLVASLGVLVVFKYLSWLLMILNQFFALIHLPGSIPTLSLVLPVGISFYTFQTLSYVIDVYRGKIKAEHNLGIYTTFITFFPQLVAGPIERSSALLPQIRANRTFDYEKAVYGMILMSWGFFKKILIADNLARYVDPIFNAATEQSGFVIVFAMVGFTFQIYCDFSGYSDIAIGTAKLFGIDLCRNFHSPYFASSIKEFWSRWHISLSTWFRDYVYIPCGGNRCSVLKQFRNLLITFFLSGLWHGAGLHFVVWGLMHGLLQCMERFVLLPKKLQLKQSAAVTVLKVFAVFAICNIAWVFFRAETLHDALWLIGHMFDGIGSPLNYLRAGYQASGFAYKDQIVGVILPIGVLLMFDYVNLKNDCIALLRKQRAVLRWSVYVVITTSWVIGFIASLASESTSTFIYFQF